MLWHCPVALCQAAMKKPHAKKFAKELAAVRAANGHGPFTG